MPANIINKIVLQDELPIILTVEISHETQIKGHHVYKDNWVNTWKSNANRKIL